MTAATRVEFCCCCTCGLRPATLAIGCFYMITSFVASTICYTIKPPESEYVSDHRREGLRIIYAVAGTVSLIQMLVLLPLIYKIYKDRTNMLQQSKIYAWACFIILCTAALLVTLIRFSAEQGVTFIILGLGVMAGTFAYFLVQTIKENINFEYRHMNPNEN